MNQDSEKGRILAATGNFAMSFAKFCFVLIFTIPNFVYSAENRDALDIERLKAEAKEAATAETAILMGRLRQRIHDERPTFNLSRELTGIAIEIFFDITFRHELKYRLADYFGLSSQQSPQVIAIKSKPRAGNTTLIGLIAKILTNDPSEIEHIFLGNEVATSQNEFMQRIEKRQILILDDFSYYATRSGRNNVAELIPELVANGTFKYIFLVADAHSLTLLNTPARRRIDTVVGSGSKIKTCEALFSTSNASSDSKPYGL